MAQHDYSIANQGFPAFRSDLNDALAAVVSNNSGATEPTTMFAHQIWVDTAADPSILKIRNADNDAWITIGTINQTGDTFTLTSAVSATTLNTSGAVVFNDAGADVDFRVEGDTNANLFFVDASADKVGIGTSSPDAVLKVTHTIDAPVAIFENARSASNGTDSAVVRIISQNRFSNLYITAAPTRSSNIYFGDSDDDDIGSIVYDHSDNALKITTNASERARIDSSGNLLVGQSSTTNPAADNVVGSSLQALGQLNITNDGGTSANFNRKTSDGVIVNFRKDGTVVGSIGVTASTDLYVINSTAGLRFQADANFIQPCNGSGEDLDNTLDWGQVNARWDDIYATNGTIQTSDANEKQDIESLSEAETRVAVAAKGLLKKYRWKSAVAEKGDDARIHFGIIAQDLKAAFEAEGLDAGRYAMFIHSEWWETQTEVPAVEAQEAVLDDEGNVVREAVEGKEAYTRTDTYTTEAEAPEGAVRKERMGIRYNELLAFIIAAI